MQHNQHIAELGPLIASRGIRHVLISPGSRNAPLIQLFTSTPPFIPHSIVDERSAGYIALGMARERKEPVLVLCTSGTAVLNLSPSVAEAYHQHIPLVILTADRPRERIRQFDNQVINQTAPFFIHSKAFLELPFEVRTEMELKQTLRSVGQLLDESMAFEPGPVHVNVPLLEPLYEILPHPVQPEPIPPAPVSENEPLPAPIEGLSSRRIMVLAGMGTPNPEMEAFLKEAGTRLDLVVIAEHISNLHSQEFIANPELVLSGSTRAEQEKLAPDVLISFGGQVVSKGLRLFIESLEEMEYLEIDGKPMDSLQALLGRQTSGKEIRKNKFQERWKEIEQREAERLLSYIHRAPYCNLSAIQKVLSLAPRFCTVHLGNSSVIRYAQLFPVRDDLSWFSNRGTSGIDGSVSAAVGAAMVSKHLHLLVVGDLSFVYDSNALWNQRFPPNLKIVVINDGGGGIFRLLDGPDRMDFFEEFSVTHHPVSLELLSQSFGREYRRAEHMEDVIRDLEALFDPGSSLSILEIDTTKSENSRIFKEFFKPHQ